MAWPLLRTFGTPAARAIQRSDNMTRPNSTLKVFVSSTSEDLRDYRAVARLAILDMDYKPEMMEHFGASTEPTIQACLDRLDGCDLMVLIVAFRRGWVPSAEQGGNGKDSITALELAHARAQNIPVLAMLAADESWPIKLCEGDQAARDWIDAFRKGLNLPAEFFDYEAPTSQESRELRGFRTTLHGALVKHHEMMLRKQEEAAADTSRPDQVKAAAWVLNKGRCIPFIGPGVHGGGPLSTRALVQALPSGAAQEEQSLATAAECSEHAPGFSRATLLEFIADQLKQAQSSPPPAVYDLLARVRPPLIISAVEDLLLEERLVREGKRVLIVCHVVRSENDRYDGKIALFRGPADEDPELCLADAVDLGAYAGGYVIYKPLGSPLLRRMVEGVNTIDTVVITEADHLVLLRRLGNQSTGIPTAFSRLFQDFPLLFLGYPLDMWHYRLLVTVFGTFHKPPPLAVGQPTGMDEQVWHWLGANLIAIDANTFAQKASESLPVQS